MFQLILSGQGQLHASQVQSKAGVTFGLVTKHSNNPPGTTTCRFV